MEQQLPKQASLKFRNILFVLVGLISFVNVSAQIRYVKPGGTGNGSSWANAAGNLQNTIDATPAGSQVWVQGGTYTWFGFSMKKGVKIYGGFAGSETSLAQRQWQANPSILKRSGQGSIIFNGNEDLTRADVLDGFIIQGGRSPVGAGMSFGSTNSPTIQNCIFEDNQAIDGQGGAIQCSGSAHPLFINCIFYNNKARFGSVFYFTGFSDVRAVNCTFVKNIATHATVGNTIDATAVASTIISSIFFANISSNTTEFSGNVNLVNCLKGVDPLFQNIDNYLGADNILGTADDGLRPTSGSQAIQAGNNPGIPAGVTTDIVGSPRVQNGKVDIGAYETPYCNPGPILYVDGNVSASGSGSGWATAFKTLNEAIDAANACAEIQQIYIAKGTYYPTGLQSGTDRNATFLFPRRGLQLYGGYPNGGGTRNIANNPTILSGEIGNPNSIADNSYHVIVVTNSLPDAIDVVIDGLTVTGGNANGGQFTYNDILTNQNEGGGILLRNNEPLGERLFVRNTTITKNNAVFGGGGLYLALSFAQTYNTGIFDNASVNNGGGVFIYLSPSVRFFNSLIAKNSAIDGGGFSLYGGSSSMFLFNCTIVDNLASGNGNNFNLNANTPVYFVNSILWSDNPAKNIYNVNAPLNFYNSNANTSGVSFSGTGNINQAPVFANTATGDYSLLSCSPGINAGNSANLSAFPMGSVTDLAGNARFYGTSVDIGAYEYQGPSGSFNFELPNLSNVTTCNNASFSGVSFPNGTSGQVCATVDEGATQTISAPAGAVFTSVIFASYGTAAGDCNTGFSLGSCHSAVSKTTVESVALYKNSFSITPTNALFGSDPCSGTFKKLNMTLAYEYPQYSWTNDNTAIGLPASGTGNIPSFTPSAAGVANITVTGKLNVCAISNPKTITVTVIPNLNASVSISNPTTTFCAGTNVAFTATPINGGTLPKYQWKKNGVTIAGATNSTYLSNTLVNNDVISVVMTSNATPCLAGSPATSNTITVTVNPILNASVTISNPTTTFCAGTNTTFTATPTNGGSAPTYQWRKNGTNISGATSASYSSTTLANNDVISVVMTSNASPCLAGSPATSNTITVTVIPTLNASVSISNPTTTFCTGTNTTFIATPTNGGTSPTYQWRKNGANISGATSSSYSSTTLANNDGISVVMTSNASPCLAGYPTTSNTITVTVNPIINASVTISNPTTTFCAGTNTTFTAIPTNGGTSPTYQWRKNGSNISGATNATYSSTTLVDNDAISVVMTSNASPCLAVSVATSNSITVTVIPTLNASVSISNPTTTFCAGANTTFTATPTNGGTSPTYQWRKNGVNISGATSATYSSTTLANNDVISVVMTSNASPCLVGSPATSNTISVTVNPILNASVSISTASTTICAGFNTTFTATPTNGGTSPSYQWKKNGNSILGATSSTYSSTTLASNDSISVDMSSDASPCLSVSQATSNSITVTVVDTPVLTASVTISTPITTFCAGTTATFTATPTNGGTPTYQWRKNGSNIPGATNATYSTTTLANNDAISVIMTSNASACMLGSPATSNTITVTVNPILPASVSIATPSATFCGGTNTTFTATPTNGGANPTYQWKRNGVTIPGATGSSYSSTTLIDKDVITVAMTSTASPCLVSSPATSNPITVIVDRTPVVTVGVSNTNMCTGQNLILRSYPEGILSMNGGVYGQEPYNSIFPATNVTSWRTNVGYGLSNSQPIGFAFNYCGKDYSNFLVSPYGFITFNTDTTADGLQDFPYGYDNSWVESPEGLIVAPYWDILRTSGNTGTIADLNASINYSTTGSPGNRVLTVEWKNMYDANNNTGPFNFQLQLFEDGDYIFFNYGTMSQTGDIDGYSLGLSGPNLGGSTYAGQLFTQSIANDSFGFTNQNSLLTVPESNSVMAFFPDYSQYVGNLAYNWTGPNGFTSSAAAALVPSVTQAASGVYNLTVTNTATGCSSAQASIAIVVNQTLTPSVTVATANSTICSGEHITFTATPINGGTAPSYQWKKNGVNIPGATNSTYSSTTLANNDAISVFMSSNATCLSGIHVISNTINVTVHPFPVGGLVSGSQTVCLNTQPTDLTLSGSVGSVLKWQKADNVNFIGATDIINTTSTLTGVAIGNVGTTTYYRAVVQNGTCSANSAYATVTVNALTTWTSSGWDNGIPTATTPARISFGYSEATDLSACSLIVDSNAIVVVPSGFDFHISGAVTVQSGSLTFENNANLLQNPATVANSNSGNIISKRVAQMRRLDYVYWSSPVSNQNLLDFSPSTITNRFYTISETTNAFVSVNPATNSFDTASGYAIRAPNTFPPNGSLASFNGQFTGVPNNGSYSVAVTKNLHGFNLIGNPYPSPIDANLFLASNPGTLYFWTHAVQGDTPGSNYATYNTMGGTAALAGGLQPNGFIQTGQGFLLNPTSSGTALFTNTMRAGNNQGQFFRNRNESIEKHRIWLGLSDSNNTSLNQILIGYMTGATQGVDSSIDGILNYTGTGIASTINDENFAIQGRSLPFEVTDEVPMNFKAEHDGSYRIAIDAIDGLFSGDQNVYLKDNLTGVIHNIKESAYSFASLAGTFANRFAIVYQNTTLGVETPGPDANSVIVYKRDTSLHVNSGSIVMASVKIVDIRGRLIHALDDIRSNTTAIDLNIPSQFLIVKITSNNNQTVTKKIMY